MNVARMFSGLVLNYGLHSLFLFSLFYPGPYGFHADRPRSCRRCGSIVTKRSEYDT